MKIHQYYSLQIAIGTSWLNFMKVALAFNLVRLCSKYAERMYELPNVTAQTSVCVCILVYKKAYGVNTFISICLMRSPANAICLYIFICIFFCVYASNCIEKKRQPYEIKLANCLYANHKNSRCNLIRTFRFFFLITEVEKKKNEKNNCPKESNNLYWIEICHAP